MSFYEAFNVEFQTTYEILDLGFFVGIFILSKSHALNPSVAILCLLQGLICPKVFLNVCPASKLGLDFCLREDLFADACFLLTVNFCDLLVNICQLGELSAVGLEHSIACFCSATGRKYFLFLSLRCNGPPLSYRCDRTFLHSPEVSGISSIVERQENNPAVTCYFSKDTIFPCLDHGEHGPCSPAQSPKNL